MAGIGELVLTKPDPEEERKRLGRPPPETAEERLAKCKALEEIWEAERQASKEARREVTPPSTAASMTSAHTFSSTSKSGRDASASPPASETASWQAISPTAKAESSGPQEYKIPKSFKRTRVAAAAF
jgi:hypothetical protein